MKAIDIELRLIKHTIFNSHFDTHRDNISLSNIIKSPDELISDMNNGYTADQKAKLKCYKGYQMERDLVQRIMAEFKEIEFTSHTINLNNGLFKGHPDLVELDTMIPWDCKSVLMDEWLPRTYRDISHKIKYQMNGYMMGLKVNTSRVVFESRESGLIRVYQLNKNAVIQADINSKMNIILNKLN
jgi:hypothetical protein